LVTVISGRSLLATDAFADAISAQFRDSFFCWLFLETRHYIHHAENILSPKNKNHAENILEG